MSANAPVRRVIPVAQRAPRSWITAIIAILACTAPNVARSDAGGVSFWLPGQFGSLAAAPGQPGWGVAMMYYHTSVDASGSAAASKQVEIGRFNPNVNLSLNVNLDARADLGLFIPSYTFETPVFGGQLAVSVASSSAATRRRSTAR